MVPLRSKEKRLSIFSKISLIFAHVKQEYTRSETEREHDTSCLASSFEREEGIILLRFFAR